MNIAILGSTGFLGSLTLKHFKQAGNSIIVINRIDLADPVLLFNKLKNSDLVINFVGSNISKKWTKSYKIDIYNSRINTTRILIESLNTISDHKIHLINVSAIGIYSDKNIHTEQSTDYGKSFLSKVVIDWENEVYSLHNSNICYSIIRLGVVINRSGGYLNKLLTINELRFLPYFGSKKYKLAFIDLFDFLNAINFIIVNKHTGIFNFCAPTLTSNYQIANYLSKFNKTSFVFCIPNFILKAIFGEGYFIFNGTPQAYPLRLLELGFIFKYDTIDKSLNNNINSFESN